MQVQWTLVVEGLGKIERAEIRTHPLTLFVGENNTGKSYLAALLWGIAALRGDTLLTDDSQAPSAALSECQKWLRKRMERRSQESKYVMQPQDNEVFLRLFNELLEEKKELIVSRIFNAVDTTVARIAIRDLVRTVPLELRWGTLPYAEGGPYLVHGPTHVTLADDFDDAENADVALQIAWRVVMDGFSQMPGWILSQSLGELLFLPASRTGFLLLKNAVVQRQLDQLLESERGSPTVQLTRPSVEFLQLLTVKLKKTAGAYREEADFLERGALQGRAELVTGVGVNEFLYYPEGGSTPLSMAQSSSLVTELIPLILVLRHVQKLPFLVLEEPEAHLHPRIQRLLAQTIVRLVRKGLKVVVTTHSENFCQQINNFMKLGSLPNRTELAKELGYGEQDYLLESDVAGYQFVSKEGRSTVTELAKSNEGLTMPTFNEELVSLTREVLRLQRAMQQGSNNES